MTHFLEVSKTEPLFGGNCYGVYVLFHRSYRLNLFVQSVSLDLVGVGSIFNMSLYGCGSNMVHGGHWKMPSRHLLVQGLMAMVVIPRWSRAYSQLYFDGLSRAYSQLCIDELPSVPFLGALF